MATAATAPRLRSRAPTDRGLLGLTLVGAAVCIFTTIALAAGHVAGSGLAAVAAAGFLLLVGWCVTHRRTDHVLVALGLYLGLLDGYVKLSTGSSTITLARDVIVLAIGSAALFRATRSQQRLALPPLGALVVAFSAVVLIELANPASRGVAGGLAGVRQHLEFVPLFFLGYAFMRRESHIHKLLLLLVLCAAAGGVVSYAQSTLTPQELAAWGPGYRERILGTGYFAGGGRVGFDESGRAFVRPFGLGSDSGAGAIAAALALPALIALLMGGRARVRWALVPLSVGIALAVATSGSRAALITAFVSVVAFGLIAAASKNALRVVVGLAVGTALVYGVFEHLGTDNTATQRARSISPDKVLDTFARERGSSVGKFGEYAYDYPLGTGVGSVGPAATIGRRSESAGPSDSETEWNFLVLEVGLVGFALIVALHLRLMSLALTRIRRMRDSRSRLYLAALAAPLFALLVAGFAGPTTATVPSAPYMWLVAGVLSYWLIGVHRTAGRT